MMIKFYTLFLFLAQCSYYSVVSQSVPTLIGARSNGMAYASSCIEDEWGLFNNVAGVAKVKNISTSFTYDVNPGFKSFSRMAAVACVPSKLGVTGFGVYKFGDNLYNEQMLSVGFANSFGIAALGLKANYIEYRIEGFGVKRAATISFGGIANLTKHVTIGAHIVNINPPKISSDEYLPTIVSVGVAFKPSEKVFLTTEVSKDLDRDISWKTGFEYQLHKKLTCRTGYHLYPQIIFFGLGLKSKKFTLDYCVQHHVSLGVSHQATVGYIVKSK